MLVERITLNQIKPQPWKNGAGLTREVAVHPQNASPDNFDWRLSVAVIGRNAPFSEFPGIDRCIVLLRGAGMRLRSADLAVDERLSRAHQAFRFSGDTPLTASLINGPTLDLNVMARRGRCRFEVSSHSGRTEAGPASAGLLLCSQGEWRVDGPALPEALTVGSLQALLWRRGLPAVRAEPLLPDSVLLVVQLRLLLQDRAPL